jgi:hypothetical protein
MFEVRIIDDQGLTTRQQARRAATVTIRLLSPSVFNQTWFPEP